MAGATSPRDLGESSAFVFFQPTGWAILLVSLVACANALSGDKILLESFGQIMYDATWIIIPESKDNERTNHN
jgi:hypothetical protein